MKKPTSRRNFIKYAAISAGFAGLRAWSSSPSPGPATSPSHKAPGFGPLIHKPGAPISLPKGFSYTSFSHTGSRMDDGFFVPAAHDGMAAFPGPHGATILVRNHEMNPDQFEAGPFCGDATLAKRVDREKFYDFANGTHFCSGGTTTLVFDTKSQSLVRHYLSLTGTLRNCSGGPTPWGSWITCEETVTRAKRPFEQDHGYNFEVPATAQPRLADPVPLKEMGRFNHEAVAVDPLTGIVYQTEDRGDGLIYRFLPNQPGKLAAGGRLQALAILDAPSADTRNWPEIGNLFPIGKPLPTTWIDMDDVLSPKDDLRNRGFAQGAARFARGEGMVFGNGELFFACTNGGAKMFGQVFRYRPSPREGQSDEDRQPGSLELFVESHENELMKSCDNITVAPWGDVILCEDDNEFSALVGITPQGKLYHLARVQKPSELAGSCFSPDGSTLFFNMQRRPGETFAVTGPWGQRQA